MYLGTKGGSRGHLGMCSSPIAGRGSDGPSSLEKMPKTAENGLFRNNRRKFRQFRKFSQKTKTENLTPPQLTLIQLTPQLLIQLTPHDLFCNDATLLLVCCRLKQNVMLDIELNITVCRNMKINLIH